MVLTTLRSGFSCTVAVLLEKKISQAGPTEVRRQTSWPVPFEGSYTALDLLCDPSFRLFEGSIECAVPVELSIFCLQQLPEQGHYFGLRKSVGYLVYYSKSGSYVSYIFWCWKISYSHFFVGLPLSRTRQIPPLFLQVKFLGIEYNTIFAAVIYVLHSMPKWCFNRVVP